MYHLKNVKIRKILNPRVWNLCFKSNSGNVFDIDRFNDLTHPINGQVHRRASGTTYRTTCKNVPSFFVVVFFIISDRHADTSQSWERPARSTPGVPRRRTVRTKASASHADFIKTCHSAKRAGRSAKLRVYVRLDNSVWASYNFGFVFFVGMEFFTFQKFPKTRRQKYITRRQIWTVGWTWNDSKSQPVP